MALAVLFLLCGILAAEIALFGVRSAGLIGALLLGLAAVVLASQREEISD